jgi:hypothetical protein
MKSLSQSTWNPMVSAVVVIVTAISGSIMFLEGVHGSHGWSWTRLACGLCLLGASAVAATRGLFVVEPPSAAAPDATIEERIAAAAFAHPDYDPELVCAIKLTAREAIAAYGSQETEEHLRDLLEILGYEIDLITVGAWSNDEFDAAWIWTIAEFNRRAATDADATTMVLAPPCVARGRVVYR